MKKRHYKIGKTNKLKKKTIQERINAKQKTSITMKAPKKELNKTNLLLKSKKNHFLGKQPKKWKLPTAILLTSLFCLILLIPTVIVVMFGDAAGSDTTSQEKKAEESVELESSPFSVAVMRSNLEKVDNVPLETYVAGVVASEMPVEFEMEALKAQALAARTYIVNYKLHGDITEEADVTDTVQHQVYKDEAELQKLFGDEYQEKMNKIKEAVNATKGEVLTYKKELITPAFFSTSNGFTENSEDYWKDELPYLRSVESHWDENTPKFLDQQTYSINQVEQALATKIPSDKALSIEITRTDGQRVQELTINGDAFSGREVREKLELRSSDFTIEQKDDHLIFTTKGYGHGIGMSQYGANGMAEEGKTYKEIVNHYYKDVEISTVTDTAPALVVK
ncbi:stage II sporulation protein D [Oceanobacillus jordanicus]|uniref:Stage II sporulation protein D n=1 Tax=Oceanobacillus jordanicus TaxID=2867266 RepID=A0AAW5AZS7_9BACI|nr:stage II sporulation protein D [Oceanobacillus jordanicus]MCG3417961.1 stage II sporulation protein D [Oceanobacillus jordanicus]